MRAKHLRTTMSSPEIVLWLALRHRPAGLKFRRQHPCGPYIADFYCHAARMIIEIDGASHDFGDRPARDDLRDRWFEARGLAVFRIPATDVLRDCDAVISGITAIAVTRIADQE
jgi:very-short-patch-repair endonuclease